MGLLDPWKRLFGRPAPPPPSTLDDETDVIEGDLDEDAPEGRSRKRAVSGWVERRAHRVVEKVYESRAGDMEERARRVVGSLYENAADDLEERAFRALRRAISAESDRIKEAIEHGVQVKKREVRLSLLVLVAAAAIYLALDWWQGGFGA